MRTLTSAEQTVLYGGNAKLALMIEMDLDSAPLYLITTGSNVTYNGRTYVGTRGVGSIDAIEEVPSEIKPIRFAMPGVASADVSLVLSEPAQGKAARIKVAALDPTNPGSPVIATQQKWAGMLDVMVLDDDGVTATVQVTAEHAAIDLVRPVMSLYSNAEQQRLFPGDLFFQYLADQVERKIVWPSLGWFKANQQ